MNNDIRTVETIGFCELSDRPIEPDFNALRAKRDASVQATMQKIADEEGIPITSLTTNFNPNKCYCACPEGPCEHKWDGEWYESQDGCMQSATCSRCGITAMSHSLRTGL